MAKWHIPIHPGSASPTSSSSVEPIVSMIVPTPVIILLPPDRFRAGFGSCRGACEMVV